MQALEVYRAKFQPSAQLARSYAMVGANVIAAETDAEARRLFTTLQQVFVGMYRNQRGQLPPPIDDIETYWSPVERAHASNMLSCSFVGSPDTVRQGLRRFIEKTKLTSISFTLVVPAAPSGFSSLSSRAFARVLAILPGWEKPSG